jgi:hypothetical protein
MTLHKGWKARQEFQVILCQVVALLKSDNAVGCVKLWSTSS